MEPIKCGNTETSSEENGPNDNHNSGTGRSYECTFCKRGFTNAQALGGHMNIHRKDKVKAKAKKNLTKSKKIEYMVNNAPSSNDQQGNYHHSSSFGGQVNYQSCFPPSNPSYPQGYNCQYASGNYGGERADMFAVYDDDHLGTNLSIGIGAAHMESSSGRGKERDGKEEWLENEVDLELRLGQYP